jgi:uncharacterized surface protein with fasciclin (FAS1) repeats
MYLRKCLYKQKKHLIMKTTKFLSIAIALLFGTAVFAQKEKTVMVGGAPMYPSKNIIENAINSKDHTTLVAAVKAAGLVETLQGKGPFTVFAPTNEAFAKLPKGTVETLLKPENKSKLQSILTYHVVAGKMSSADIAKAIKKGNGKAVLATVQGSKLTAWMDGKTLYITDENGNKSKVTIADVNQSNGVIHVVDTVVMPKA